ncbi:MAG: hypothetical protein ACI8PB_002904 [Desulforhopalus sp.]|jgi:hypothetical protein
MISIGVVVLSDHLLLPGVKNLASRAGSTRMTLGGRPVHQSIPIAAGQQLILTDPGEYGLFTGDQLDAINLYKATGETVGFIHHLGSWRVIVDEVSVEQSDGLADPTGSHTYIGTITMTIMGAL